MDDPRPNGQPLPEEQAWREAADRANAAILWRLAAAVAVVSAGAGLMFFALAEHWPMGVALANAAALGLLYARSGSGLLTRHFRKVCLGFIVGEAALAAAPFWSLSGPLRVALTGLAVPLLVLAFRFRRGEYALAYLALWGMTVWLWLTNFSPPSLWSAPQGLGGWLWPTLASAGLFAAANQLIRERRRRFLGAWRRETSLDRERERMREEIEDARQIQLSMLPRATPQLAWLDLSGVSMPASEVGGDYFDYFALGPESLAVVIGDVAGHGLASGLLLSGLRSCLYLLRRELSTPAEVLGKLDDMVRHTTSKRMLVTLQCAFLDGGSRRLTLSSAGHPPALLYAAAAGRVEELALPALPLGTRLPAGYRELTLPLAPGDVLAFYSDGLTEMANGGGEAYGAGRLARVLSEAAHGNPAREIRNAVLADLANFKGDRRRLDDVTLVVVRVR
jgi:serine phosphatase RsbU (regulator of sigma subunit)